jgi:2'-5' RNA ligase
MILRLFTAITFTEEIKIYLYQTIEELKKCTVSGSFTAKDNLHLTVNFIGETGRIEEVKQAMDRAVAKEEAKSFLMTVGGLGRFKRREGDIYWIGVEEERTLWRLQKELSKRLEEAGFVMEERNFTPHLTLGRRVVAKDSEALKRLEASITPRVMEVTKLSLMKSERILGKLVYTEIYHVDLGRPV